MKKLVLVFLLLNYLSTTKAQSLNWFVSAQGGANNYRSTSVHGALLAGFQNQLGHQISVGPVVKGFVLNGILRKQVAGRLYSQLNLTRNLDAYLQCDVSGFNELSSRDDASPIKIATGMGLSVMLKDNIGIGCGYTFGEHNPLTNQRKSSPSLKLIYTLPLSESVYW